MEMSTLTYRHRQAVSSSRSTILPYITVMNSIRSSNLRFITVKKNDKNSKYY